MSLAGCQIELIYVNFHIQKFWNFLIQIQLTKSDPKDKEIKLLPIKPIRVKTITHFLLCLELRNEYFSKQQHFSALHNSFFHKLHDTQCNAIKQQSCVYRFRFGDTLKYALDSRSCTKSSNGLQKFGEKIDSFLEDFYEFSDYI